MTGIICATETEMKAIINEIEGIKENKIGRITFFEGKFNNKDIVFVQSGIGKVNAAVTATLLIDKYIKYLSVQSPFIIYFIYNTFFLK